MADRCRELLASHFELVTEAGGGTLVTWKADGDAAEISARLGDEGVVIRDLPGLSWLRASCGFWTSAEELERLVAAL
jgi:selenocysteine lyase/cysteine desulfurase